MNPKRTRTATHPRSPDGAEVAALPFWKSFVVQFSRETRKQTGTFAGRIEHLSSGRRVRFASAKELLAALGKMLDQLGEDST